MRDFQPVIDDLKEKLAQTRDDYLIRWLNKLIQLFEALNEREVSPKGFSKELAILKRQLDAQTKHTMLRSSFANITEAVRKQTGLTIPKYYINRNLSSYGILVGIPLGLLCVEILNNWGTFTFPVIIIIPIAIYLGAQKDKKAKATGTQLDI